MTSIEWLWEQIDGIIPYQDIKTSQLFNGVLEQAKLLHKQEIIDAAERWKGTDFAERYYQETFVSKGSDDTLKDYHIVEVNEMVELPKQDVDKLGNEDVPKLGYDADIREIALKNYPFGNAERNAFIAGYNKAKEHYELVLSARELHNYKLGLIDGQKKAKKTLYTEEQVREAIEKAKLLDYNNKFVFTTDHLILSLKQPKQ